MEKRRVYQTIKKGLVLTIVTGTIAPPVFLIVKKTFNDQLERLYQHFTPVRVAFNFSDLYNQEVADELIELINQKATTTSFINLDKQELCNTIKEKYPIVNHIEWSFNSDRTLQVIIKGLVPKLVINNKYILTQSRSLFALHWFKDFDLENSLHITLDNKLISEQVSQKLYAFLTTLSSQIHSEFMVEYNDPSQIFLFPKKDNPQYHILVDEKSITDHAKLKFAHTAFEQYMHDHFNKTKTKPFVAIDARFKDRVIIKKLKGAKGGGKHEKKNACRSLHSN
ncbi:MAG: hypothetical protein H6679_00125 [Epsilonproteobacteria bacterium]|nr:hypothetical protein [Campylobacterota bacterium]